MNPQEVQLTVGINEDIKKGRYANTFQLTRGQEEATLDFTFVHPQSGGDVVARVIVTPVFLQQITELLGKQAQQPAITEPGQTVSKQIGFSPNPEASKASDTKFKTE